MKIAQVISTFPPYHGGMGYVCLHNAHELAMRGHDVTVFTLDHGRTDYTQDPRDFKIVRLKTPFRFGDGGVVPQLCSRLAAFDIVHLHYPFYGGAEYVYLASILSGRKYFLTYHMDVYGDDLLKRMLINAYELAFMRMIIRGAAGIGALSRQHLQSSKIAHFVDWSKVVEIPNGVDAELFRPREKDPLLLQQHGLRGRFVVLFVGNLQPFKGLHLLIEALARVKSKDIVLLVVGGGYGEEEYKGQVREKGLQDRVIFAGPQSPSGDLPRYYSLGDVLALPSVRSEAFPLVVLEAMASGRPVLVSSLPGPSSLIEEGVDGVVARVGDIDDLRQKMERLAQDPDQCRMMGEAAREKVRKRYNWSEIGGLLERKFEALISFR